MANILVVYAYSEYEMRASTWDHLYCFQKHANHRCFYINLAVNSIPTYFQYLRFDLIIFHTLFICQRWNLTDFQKAVKKAEPLRKLNVVKIALPQDEFLQTDVLCEFINEFKIDYVFSVAPESEWHKIYPTVDFQRVRFFTILTGYLEDNTIKKIQELEKTITCRSIDIGYRAWQVDPWLGRHGMQKSRITELFQKESQKKNLITDLSVRTEDAFLGDDWYKFLLSCKYTIGVEGGASILDTDGKIRKATNQFLLEHPDASFDEVETHCFPTLDGSLQLFAISPRHLEACLTRTCQVLIEGKYNEVLLPGKHYIKLKADFSNIEDVLEIIKSDNLRNEITRQAYEDIVLSEKYTYKNFVEWLLNQCLNQVKIEHNISSVSRKSIKSVLGDDVLCDLANWLDRFDWIKVFIISSPKRLFKRLIFAILPPKLVLRLRRIKHSKT